MNATSGRNLLTDMGVRTKMAILVAVGVVVAVVAGVLALRALGTAAGRAS
ncbi:hypothetical protein ACIA5C_45600 [Actinoplanes sp. NPDC051343]